MVKRIIKKIIKKLTKLFNKFFKLKEKYGLKRLIVMGICYGLYKIFLRPIIKLLILLIKKPKNNRIIMESKPDYDDNARALSEYMVNNGYTNKYQIIWLVKNPNEYQKYHSKNIKFIRSEGKNHLQRTVRAYYYSLTSKYVFFTHSFKWYQERTKGQIVINLWHGCGYKASRRGEGSKNIFDVTIVPGDVFVDTKAVFFDIKKEQVLPLGYPRYDLFRNDNPRVNDFLQKLGGKNRKTVLWMPTFIQSKDLLYYDNPIPSIIGLPLLNSVYDIDRIDEICKRLNINLIIKRHRLGSNVMSDNSENTKDTNIFYLENEQLRAAEIQLYEFISHVDALITDVSSVAVDFMLLDKPMAFTLDGYDDYKKTRGFVFENAKKYMPGRHVYDIEQLEDFLLSVSKGEDLEREARHNILPEMHNVSENYCKRVLDHFGIE